MHLCILFFFFFQAEDGIRDVAVTGVQTCALPIFFAAASKVRTVCVKRASTGLCGGCRAIGIPTATETGTRDTAKESLQFTRSPLLGETPARSLLSRDSPD